MLRRSFHSLNKASPFVFGKDLFKTHDSPILAEPYYFVNGEFKVATKGATNVLNPSTGASIGMIPNNGTAETNEAIAAAEKAFPEWAGRSARERAVVLRKFQSLMEKYHADLAAIITREAGKPLAEAGGENVYSSRFIEWYAAEAERVYGDIIPSAKGHGMRTIVQKRPVGVVGIVTPWNFPTAMITRAAGGALAAGCTVVIKPSEETPFSALALCQIASEAGVPSGVFNVVMGQAKEIGDALTDSFAVRKISFTGSTRVGKELMARSAQTVKKVAMELGGNAPCIIFDDADMNRAVDGAMAAKFRNAGQTCVCSNRVFVHESIHDEFVSKIVERVKALKVGDGLLDPSITMGPLINAAARDRVAKAVQTAVAAGAKVEVGGEVPLGPGNFYLPTVLTNCTNESTICTEEIFGPVMPIIKFKTDEEVIKMANDTKAGLAAYMFTESPRRQWNLSEKLQFGMVGVNDGVISNPAAPFGGVKESGLGRDGSKYGIDAFLNIHYILHSNL